MVERYTRSVSFEDSLKFCRAPLRVDSVTIEHERHPKMQYMRFDYSLEHHSESHCVLGRSLSCYLFSIIKSQRWHFQTARLVFKSIYTFLIVFPHEGHFISLTFFRKLYLFSIPLIILNHYASFVCNSSLVVNSNTSMLQRQPKVL